MPKLILASQSPRRQELLSLFGLPFSVIPSGAEENCREENCAKRVCELAKLKCLDIAGQYPNCMVLGADTLVCVDGRILGKPKNPGDAADMLGLLSGRTHTVYTGVCLYHPNEALRCTFAESEVEMLPIPRESILRYVATGEPMDKAGAYAIQGKAGVFVRSVRGSYSNVIGLPLHVLTEWFLQLGISLFPQISPNNDEMDVGL